MLMCNSYDAFWRVRWINLEVNEMKKLVLQIIVFCLFSTDCPPSRRIVKGRCVSKLKD